MTTRMFKLLKAMALFHSMGQEAVTIGELAKWTNIPKSTARRNLEKLVQLKLVDSTSYNYKSSYAWALSMSKLGNEIHMQQREMFQ